MVDIFAALHYTEERQVTFTVFQLEGGGPFLVERNKTKMGPRTDAQDMGELHEGVQR